MAIRLYALVPLVSLVLALVTMLLGDVVVAGPCPSPDAGGC
jgi:hypothetical protein